MMEKKKLLFVINQFFKGGAETALLNLFGVLPKEQYEIDFLVYDQIDLPGTISLIPYIPSWVHIANVAQGEAQNAFLKKAWFRLYRKMTHRQLFRKAAIDYLRGKEYDVAISYGEWFSSRLVAEYVQARWKYVWIHADIDKATFVHPDIEKYQQHFDRFIFVSKRSMECGMERYAFIKGRGVVVHNLVNEKQLQIESTEKAELPKLKEDLPVLVTVANIRAEKNHLRQIRAMEKVFQKGKRFYWINIGSLANFELVSRVKTAVQKAGLEEYFLLPGAMENPYSIMKQANAVCVLSDHESWSMVITEAKALGVPVIATRTSGALEQLEGGKTGLLCDFSEEDIAQTIYAYLEKPETEQRIRAGLQGFSSSDDTLEQITPLLQNSRKKILYLFDDINYLSGARNAALEQMRHLSEEMQVDLFSVEPCRDKKLNSTYRTIDMSESSQGKGMRCLSTPGREVLRGNEYSWKWKWIRMVYAVLARLGKEQLLLRWASTDSLKGILNGYDAVCVVSEASKLRETVSQLKGPKKIQWIHTDYAAWREQTTWTRAITKRDGKVYKRFDTIVCLSGRLREKFIQIYPQLDAKTVSIPNFIQYDRIRELGGQPTKIIVDRAKCNLVTIGRMEQEKRYDLVLQTAAELKKQKIDFHWYLVGDGVLLEKLRQQSKQLQLTNVVTFTGMLKNPCPLMEQCSMMVLLSDYEGTPVTIDEAKVLGLPVLSKDIGGIKEQLENGRHGAVLSETENVCKKIQQCASIKGKPLSKEEWQDHTLAVEKKLAALFE